MTYLIDSDNRSGLLIRDDVSGGSTVIIDQLTAHRRADEVKIRDYRLKPVSLGREYKYRTEHDGGLLWDCYVIDRRWR